MKSWIFVLMFLAITIVMAGNVKGVCTTPIESINITGNNMTCVGTYYLNDTDSGAVTTNGAIRIVENSTLTCNNTIFIGDYNISHGSYGIWYAGKNITIINCTFLGYQNGIGYDSFTSYAGLTISGNLINDTLHGIKVRNYANVSIIGNRIYDDQTSGTIEGILTKGTGGYKNITIRYNVIDGFKYGIDVEENGAYIYIDNNNISNLKVSSGAGIQFKENGANYSIVHDNRIINVPENSMQIYSSECSFYNNYIANYGHHGLDAHLVNATNNTYYNNYITTTDDAYRNNGGQAGIYLSLSNNNVVYNNTIYNVSGSGIEIYANTTTNNKIYNNTINYATNYTTSSGICLEDHGLNNYWYQNNVNNCADYDVYISPVGVVNLNSTYYENIKTGGNILFSLFGNTTNISVSGNSNGFSILAGTNQIPKVHLYNLQAYYPFNDVLNNSDNTLLSVYANSFDANFVSGQRLNISDFDCSKHFRDSGIGYSCNATSCYFTNTNCTFKTGRTS